MLTKAANRLEFNENFRNHPKMNIQILQNGKWNGLMASLVEKKYDLVLTALKVREGFRYPPFCSEHIHNLKFLEEFVCNFPSSFIGN